MKYIAAIAALLGLAVAPAFAQETQVKMTFSGTAASSFLSLQQPNSSSDEDNFAGGGSLGSFTLRNLRALPNSPSTSSTCSGPNQLFFTESAGGGIFRFQDGSLLYLTLIQGNDCIDLSAGSAHCVLSFQVAGGTGHFKNASGSLTMNETAVPVLSDALNNPVLYAATGQFTGTISGVTSGQDQQGEQQDGQQ